MKNINIPKITNEHINESLATAKKSERRRHPIILHKKGDKFNHVFNFMMSDSYMQPHLHPGNEKIEYIYLIFGKVKVIFFDSNGNICSIHFLEKNKMNFIEVPAFTWHTYVIISKEAITYETMDGVYKKETWKEYALWAPEESSKKSIQYLESLKNS